MLAMQTTNYATETVTRLTANNEQLKALANSLGDPVIEGALIGKVLAEPDLYDLLTVMPRDFSNLLNAMFFHCIGEIITTGNALDVYNLNNCMMQLKIVSNSKDWTSERLYTEIANFQSLAPGGASIESLEQTILDNAVRIRTSAAYLFSLQAITDKSIGVDDALSQGGKAIDEAMQRVVVKPSDIGSIYQRMIEGGETIEYLSTGFAGLNEFIVGFPTKQLSVVGAETGKGKTTFFINIAGAVSANELTVVFVKETSDIEALQKLFMNYTGVPVESYGGKGLNDEELQRVTEASTQILQNKLVIVDDVRPFTPQNVMRRFRKIEREWGEPIRLCIVDGLYNSDHPETSDLFEKQVRVIADYEAYAKVTDAAFVLTAQLKKNTYLKLDTQQRAPDLDDFEGWNKAYHGVHNIFAMVYSLIDRETMKFYTLKQRSRSEQKWGQYHTFYIDKQYNRYTEQPAGDIEPPFDSDENKDDIPF